MCQFYCDISSNMSCCIVILIVCVMPLAYEAKEIQTISLTLAKAEENEEIKCVNNKQFIFNFDVPTVMYIYGSDYIEKHDCYTSANRYQKLNVNKLVKHRDGFYEANVNNLIETHLTCIFTLQYNKEVQCDFEIAIKYWNALNVFINGEQLITPSNTKPSGADVQYDYFFTPNEIIKVECKQPENKFGKLQYEFVSSRKYNSTAEAVGSVEVQLVLKAEDDKSYFDCKFITNLETIARVHMVLDTTLETNFKVNGLAIRPLLGPNVSYAYSGVLPNVSCKDSPVKPTNDSVGNWKATCEDTMLLLNKKIRSNGIKIFGLSDEKITFEMCQHAGRASVIYYEFTDNETIELVCKINDIKLNWTVGDNLRDDRSVGTELNVFKRSMGMDDNSSSIICSRQGGFSTSIVFQYVEKHALQGFENTVATFVGYIDDTTTANAPPTTEPWTLTQMTVYIGGGVLVIVLVLLLICILVLCRRRKQVLKSKPIYSNLEGDGQPQPVRRQNENIYSNQPTSETDEYAVPADVQTDANPYSVPYTGNTEDLYAKPTPKNQRPNPQEEEVKYAVVEFKNTNQPAKRKPQANTETIYSEIKKNEDLYAKVAKNEYDNEFHSGYVNSNQREYAEPAYCQVGAFNK